MNQEPDKKEEGAYERFISHKLSFYPEAEGKLSRIDGEIAFAWGQEYIRKLKSPPSHEKVEENATAEDFKKYLETDAGRRYTKWFWGEDEDGKVMWARALEEAKKSFPTEPEEGQEELWEEAGKVIDGFEPPYLHRALEELRKKFTLKRKE